MAVHDFVIPELGKVNPYGVYDPTRNEGWVNVGIDHDTAAFAVASIRGWWRSMGQPAYPDATKLLITADGGGRKKFPIFEYSQGCEGQCDYLQHYRDGQGESSQTF